MPFCSERICCARHTGYNHRSQLDPWHIYVLLCSNATGEYRRWGVLFLDIPYILSVWERCVSMVDWKCAFSRMRPFNESIDRHEVNMIFLFSVMETIFGCKWASDVTVERVLCINMWWWMKNSTFFAAKKPLVQWQKNVYSTQKWSNHQVILRVVYSIYGNPQYFFSIGYAIGHKSSNSYELTAEPRDNRLMLFLSLVTLTRQ